MLAQLLPSSHSEPDFPSQASSSHLEHTQKSIYEFLIEVVKYCPPQAALDEFQNLFINSVSVTSTTVNQVVYQLIISNNELEFRNTLKRSCYILINNWRTQKNHQAIQDLVQLFNTINFNRKTASLTLRRLTQWLENFVKSQDYEELKLLASAYTTPTEKHWSYRYTSYLLVSQYINNENSVEQRETAQVLSRQLKEQFKRDLALYVARSQSLAVQGTALKNPTLLGDEVLLLIKKLIARKCLFSYSNLASIFLKQTQELTYKYFKRSLRRYLVYSMSNQELAESIKQCLFQTLESLYEVHHDRYVDDALLLRTCNRVIECLTTEDRQNPSPLFISFVAQRSPITLVILLLKLILISPNSRTHLEACIADLIRYYKGLQESDCEWAINFLEIFSVIFTIYAEDVEYNLLKIRPKSIQRSSPIESDIYQIFSQFRGYIPLPEV